MFSSLKRKLFISLFVFIIIMVLLVGFIEITLQPILHNICEVKITSMLTKMINKSVNHQADTMSYNDLVTIKTNQKGEIILMQPNLQVINDLSSNITMELQKQLDRKNNKFIEIPVFRMLGIEVLSKLSPNLTAKIIPYGSTSTNIIDEFESVGINQSRHKIYLKVKTKVKVILPLLGTDIKVATNVPLSEAVIVGQVPEVYVGVEDGIFKKK
ncbi:MAG: sporulation protein YunB [Bacillota bacterium]